MLTKEELFKVTEEAAGKLLKSQSDSIWYTNWVAFNTLVSVLLPSRKEVEGTKIREALLKEGIEY